MNSFFSSSRQFKGQGLVEYAIIIALVAVVVIAVAVILGPRIGNTYSSINNSLAIGNDAEVETEEETFEDWTFAADENGMINVPSGAFQVRYGANGQYFYQYFTGPTTVNCNNATFGDPIVGVHKSCYLKSQP